MTRIGGAFGIEWPVPPIFQTPPKMTAPIQEGVADEVTRRISPSNSSIPESTPLTNLNRSKRSQQRLDFLSPLPPFAPVKRVSLASAATAFAPLPESTLLDGPGQFNLDPPASDS